jgi:plasmid rolling circle replication initiator protein Rep
MFLGLLLPMKKKPKLSDVAADRYLANISTKDSVWDNHRKNACIVSELYRKAGYEKYPQRIDECAQSLYFDRILLDDGKSAIRLNSAKFCRVRFCPVCQWRKSRMWTARIKKNLPKILQDHPTAKFLFLTLTVRNCPLGELRATIDDMNRAWKRMTVRKDFPAIGFVRSLEVTRADDGTAHPHFHCLLMVKPAYFSRGYLSQNSWSDLWQSCMRLDYKPIVNIKAVKPKGKKDSGEITTAVTSSLVETLKYSVKESDLIMDSDWLDQLTGQMHKVRTVSLGGIFKKYMSEDDPEDLIHDGEELEETKILIQENDPLIFDWFICQKKYVKRNSQE